MYIYLSSIHVYESIYLSSGYHTSPYLCKYLPSNYLSFCHREVLRCMKWTGMYFAVWTRGLLWGYWLTQQASLLSEGKKSAQLGFCEPDLWVVFTHCHISSQPASKHTFQLWGNLRSWHHWNLLGWQCQKNSLISKSNVKFYFEVLLHFNGWLNFFFEIEISHPS